MSYSNIREEELKNKIAQDYFPDFDCTKIIGNVDFCVIPKLGSNQDPLFETQSLLWAEAKKGKSDIINSIVQLILTIGKARTFDKQLPPAFLGAFDGFQMAFLPYNDIHEIFYQNDFNWNVTPSNYETKEFKQLHATVKTTIEANSLQFSYDTDHGDIQEFIKTNFIANSSSLSKIQIDKNNFLIIYNKWLAAVKPSINFPWDNGKKHGIMDSDFYLADLFSDKNETIKDGLYAILKNNLYELDRKVDVEGFFNSKKASFNDVQKAHNQFWNRYERPPKKEYWDYIIERKELLLPQDVRERKGSFFTPQIWVELSQKYLADTLGENWQDEYYIWDCAAGTGNLLRGLVNKYNIWASTLDQSDVDVMKDLVKSGANLLDSHCFQFDFLNDEFTKLPVELQKIISDPEKRKKLVIYINPPYAEATSGTTVTGTGENKAGVATKNKTNEKYKSRIGNASNEMFALFMARIYDEIKGCKLAQFSKLKFVQGTNFKDFRNFFLTKYLGGFVVRANTFDNVKGQFPISFTIWDLDSNEKIKQIKCDVLSNYALKLGEKSFFGELPESINKWLAFYYQNKTESNIGVLSTRGNDFQNQKYIYLATNIDNETHDIKVTINSQNLIPACIYLTVRQVIGATWLNDRDQFLFPVSGWNTDQEFQNDCLVYTLFHSQNRITGKDGVNHWIPFTEYEVNSGAKFESNFMTNYIEGKIKKEIEEDLYNSEVLELDQSFPLEFSSEAKIVFDTGRELWRYYHSCYKYTKNGFVIPNSVATFNFNASLYDIREYFQGRNPAGKMNSRSEDEQYTQLIDDLRNSLKLLAKKIQPKVYEYGFLKA